MYLKDGVLLLLLILILIILISSGSSTGVAPGPGQKGVEKVPPHQAQEPLRWCA